MKDVSLFKTIAHIRCDFQTKFGIPRQSGIVETLRGVVVFEPDFRKPEAVRGLEGFSHVWLVWKFSQTEREEWSPTVRPPRLGGNTRVGVFATRSPYRPNAIGLSSVRLEGIESDPHLGPVLRVSGVDLMDQTPILDIKPYLPFTDSHPEATAGFAQAHDGALLEVAFPQVWLERIPAQKREALIGALEQDPRPSYHRDDGRIYGFVYAGYEVRFAVSDTVLTVCEVRRGSSPDG